MKTKVIFKPYIARKLLHKEIDPDYSGDKNCDYKIFINGKCVYVELAGILGNPAHQRCYLTNTPISSKSKERYRQGLNIKREMFERNHLNYYILLPKEMNIVKYQDILNKFERGA